jgi:hypothetical protein
VFRYYQGSKEGFFKVLEINKKNFGEDHVIFARNLKNLSIILRNFGEDHVIFARNLNNLSIILRNLGDYERAKKGN